MRRFIIGLLFLQLSICLAFASIQEIGGHLEDGFYNLSLTDMTPDGCYILFTRSGGNNQELNELHLYNRQSGTYELIATGSQNGLYFKGGKGPMISDDGNKVAYFSFNYQDFCIETYDRTTGNRVKHLIPNLRPDYANISMDGNGRYIAYSHLVEWQSGMFATQARLYDTQIGSDYLISDDPYSNENSGYIGCISNNGNYIVLSSKGNLAAEDTDYWNDFYLYDVVNGSHTLVADHADYPYTNDMLPTDVSNDGQKLFIYEPLYSGVPAPVTNPASIFEYDVQSQNYSEDVTYSTPGVFANHDNHNPDASLDGRYVVFESEATNLVNGDTNGVKDIFRRDRIAHLTQRINISNDGAEGDNGSYDPFVSDDGRFIAFESTANNFITINPLDGVRRIYLVDWQPLTISQAEYNSRKDSLTVSVESDLGGNNTIVLNGYGSMTYKNGWSITVNNVGGNPGTVTATGVEGSVTVPTTVK